MDLPKVQHVLITDKGEKTIKVIKEDRTVFLPRVEDNQSNSGISE